MNTQKEDKEDQRQKDKSFFKSKITINSQKIITKRSISNTILKKQHKRRYKKNTKTSQKNNKKIQLKGTKQRQKFTYKSRTQRNSRISKSQDSKEQDKQWINLNQTSKILQISTMITIILYTYLLKLSCTNLTMTYLKIYTTFDSSLIITKQSLSSCTHMHKKDQQIRSIRLYIKSILSPIVN